MALHHNPRIVTDNSLVLLLDAADTNSYPGSGTTWYDISGNSNHVTLYNSPTYSDNTFTGNGTNSYGRTTSELDLTAYRAVTVSAVFKVPTTSSQGMIYEHTANWNSTNSNGYGGFGLYTNSNGSSLVSNLNHTQLKGNSGYSGANASSPDNTSFQYYTAIHDFTQGIDETVVYINGEYVAASTDPSAGSSYNADNTIAFDNEYFYLFSRGGSSSWSNGTLALLSIYNRALNASEIEQNYEAQKTRFGL